MFYLSIETVALNTGHKNHKIFSDF